MTHLSKMAVTNSSAFLPTIKCSNCGIDIEIERLADHLCRPGNGASMARPPPRSFNDAFSNMSVNQAAPAPFRQKPILKPIDSDIANNPYSRRPVMPIASQSYNRPGSPGGNRMPVPGIQRSATLPSPRSPSPELSRPQECAFPAFPFPRAPTTPRSLDRSNTHPLSNSRTEHNANNTEQSVSSLQENSMDPSASTIQQQEPRQIRDSTLPSLPKLTTPIQDSEASAPSQMPMRSVASTTNAAAAAAFIRPASRSSISHARNKSVSAANRPLDEIGSVRTHRSRPSQGGLALSPQLQDQPRSASAQGHRYGRSIHANPPPMPGGLGITIDPVLRSASADGSREPTTYQVPPIPKPISHYKSDSQSTTGHTPSESTSSNQSDASHPATSSSQSSPPTSPPRRQYQTSINPYTSIAGNQATTERPIGRPAAKSFSRPSYAQPTPPILSPETFEQVSAGPWGAPPREQSRDIGGTFDYNHKNGPYRDNPPHPPAPISLADNIRKAMLDDGSDSKQGGSPPEVVRSAILPGTGYGFPDSRGAQRHQAPIRRAATVSKGKCRGCNHTITGKSVSSADGRLTGRWHKECFTCKTCSEPFPTMDFYVFGNDPYCSRHYHQLNRSLCTSCDRGIEGQYVDNDRNKFHPHCFTCSECHLILRDTYFDLNGKIFCERHAFKTSPLTHFGSGRRFPEKRSTRLMMM